MVQRCFCRVASGSGRRQGARRTEDSARARVLSYRHNDAAFRSKDAAVLIRLNVDIRFDPFDGLPSLVENPDPIGSFSHISID